MALLLMREGTDPAIALNSAARLSDATPKQVDFADDLIRRRAKAYENATAETRIEPGKWMKINKDFQYKHPGSIYNSNSLFRLNKSQEPNSEFNRLTRSQNNLYLGRQVGINSAEDRLRQELALAAADGDSQRMQALLVELGYMPDLAYNVASRYFA